MGIKMKRSAVASKVPATTDLELGELGVNTYDGKLFLKKSVGGTESIVEVGPVASVAGKTGAVTLAKADVGLGNVDNTSDAAKPISMATQTALNGKAAASHGHAVGDITGLGTAATLNVGTGPNNIVQLDGSSKLPAVDGSQLTNLPGAAGTGRLLRAPQVLTSGTAYTTPAGCTAIYLELQGGGGGGGGVDATFNNAAQKGAGGGSGAFATKYFAVSPNTSYSYAIGGGGAGGPGTGGGNPASGNGTAGGNTTFTVSGVTVTAGGGGGGGGAGDSSVNSPGDGGITTNADFGVVGIKGGNGFYSTTTGSNTNVYGLGGDSLWGGGGKSYITGDGVGASASGYGAGGEGGANDADQAGSAGGAGAQGFIRIWEFS